jgi:hypothetical protein
MDEAPPAGGTTLTTAMRGGPRLAAASVSSFFFFRSARLNAWTSESAAFSAELAASACSSSMSASCSANLRLQDGDARGREVSHRFVYLVSLSGKRRDQTLGFVNPLKVSTNGPKKPKKYASPQGFITDTEAEKSASQRNKDPSNTCFLFSALASNQTNRMSNGIQLAPRKTANADAARPNSDTNQKKNDTEKI